MVIHLRLLTGITSTSVAVDGFGNPLVAATLVEGGKAWPWLFHTESAEGYIPDAASDADLWKGNAITTLPDGFVPGALSKLSLAVEIQDDGAWIPWVAFVGMRPPGDSVGRLYLQGLFPLLKANGVGWYMVELPDSEALIVAPVLVIARDPLTNQNTWFVLYVNSSDQVILRRQVYNSIKGWIVNSWSVPVGAGARDLSMAVVPSAGGFVVHIAMLKWTGDVIYERLQSNGHWDGSLVDYIGNYEAGGKISMAVSPGSPMLPWGILAATRIEPQQSELRFYRPNINLAAGWPHETISGPAQLTRTPGVSVAVSSSSPRVMKGVFTRLDEGNLQLFTGMPPYEVLDVVDVGAEIEHPSVAIRGNGLARMAYEDSYTHRLMYFEEEFGTKMAADVNGYGTSAPPPPPTSSCPLQVVGASFGEGVYSLSSLNAFHAGLQMLSPTKLDPFSGSYPELTLFGKVAASGPLRTAVSALNGFTAHDGVFETTGLLQQPTSFDGSLGKHIESVFADLTPLGVGEGPRVGLSMIQVGGVPFPGDKVAIQPLVATNHLTGLLGNNNLAFQELPNQSDSPQKQLTFYFRPNGDLFGLDAYNYATTTPTYLPPCSDLAFFSFLPPDYVCAPDGVSMDTLLGTQGNIYSPVCTEADVRSFLPTPLALELCNAIPLNYPGLPTQSDLPLTLADLIGKFGQDLAVNQLFAQGWSSTKDVLTRIPPAIYHPRFTYNISGRELAEYGAGGDQTTPGTISFGYEINSFSAKGLVSDFGVSVGQIPNWAGVLLVLHTELTLPVLIQMAYCDVEISNSETPATIDLDVATVLGSRGMRFFLRDASSLGFNVYVPNDVCRATGYQALIRTALKFFAPSLTPTLPPDIMDVYGRTVWDEFNKPPTMPAGAIAETVFVKQDGIHVRYRIPVGP